MRYHAILLADTAAARDRCFDLGVSRALKLNRQNFIAAVENLAQKDGQGAGHLSAYASVVAQVELSCLTPLAAATRTEPILVERMLNEAVIALASIGGGPSIMALLFSVETLNIDWYAKNDRANPSISEKQRKWMLEALGDCLEGFARNDDTRSLILASAHHSFDLISAFCDHEYRLDGELAVKHTVDRRTQLQSRWRN